MSLSTLLLPYQELCAWHREDAHRASCGWKWASKAEISMSKFLGGLFNLPETQGIFKDFQIIDDKNIDYKGYFAGGC